ncbi:MAG: ADP-ribosylglycohydrolase family protein, partial [Oscillospiraceae bacterium]|nr:ADP-ribosylglycohydrolase family protein [Oscillospiraceae bacterium]
MLSRNEFIQDRARVFDKVYGALSGLAIGDSFGDASRKPENRAAYQVTTDFNKGASWSTDDTEFAL